MRISSAVPTLVLASVLLQSLPVSAQAPRKDAIWARRSTSPITLDGVLGEAAWSMAESVVVRMAQDAGIPGSGYKYEAGVLPSDPTHATLKFLVVGNELYLGAIVRDQSIGGSLDFNRFDGLLMALKDHADAAAPKPPSEYFYAWWYPENADPQPTGQSPAFIGRWADWPPGSARTPQQIANWDAVTVVNGLSNSDATLDSRYTIEMRFNLTAMGYDVTRVEGDVVEWNVSIYDCDWYWPLDVPRFSANRVWWQGPWGNTMWYHQVSLFARPDITTSTAVLPAIGPELSIPNATNLAAPVLDGLLNEQVWNFPAYAFDIRYGDDALRQTYPGNGPYRAGQYQPTVNGGQAAILDPADARVKMFHHGDRLYLGFDVRDQVVQYHANFDRWDGFVVTLNERVARGPDNQLLGRRLSFQVGPTGAAVPGDYLTTLVSNGGAQVAMALKPGTSVDTLGTSADTGYTAEMWIDLTRFGYPSGLGDRAVFLGVNHLDGDSFLPFTDSYGTRTWWFREYEAQCCPVWGHLDSRLATDAGEPPDAIDTSVLLGAFPNPGRQSAIRYALARSSRVTLHVFDVAGRLVDRQDLGVLAAGERETLFEVEGSGMYLYRIDVEDPSSGTLRKSLTGRIVVVK